VFPWSTRRIVSAGFDWSQKECALNLIAIVPAAVIGETSGYASSCCQSDRILLLRNTPRRLSLSKKPSPCGRPATQFYGSSRAWKNDARLAIQNPIGAQHERCGSVCPLTSLHDDSKRY